MQQVDIAAPHDKDLEEAVLAALLTNKALLLDISGILDEKVFYVQKHRYICQAIAQLGKDDRPVDLLTVSMQLNRMGRIKDIGGVDALSRLASKASGLTSTSYHYRVLMELALRREMILAARQLLGKAHNLSQDVFDTHRWMLDRLSEMDKPSGDYTPSCAKEAARETIALVDNPEGEKRFYPIGDKNIDQVLATAPSNLVNISGKSGVGKTSFAAMWARGLLESYPSEVAFCWYTMEDEASKLIMGFVSARFKLTYDQMLGRNFVLSPEDKTRVAEAVKAFSGYDVEFFERPEHIGGIKNHFRRFCSQRPGKFNILIVDNISKLRDYQANRFKAISSDVDDYIAGELHDLFTNLKKNHRLSIWYLHHLGKEQLSRTNLMAGYRPWEGAVKGSTSLRDIATQGILINRPGEFDDLVRQFKGTGYYQPIQKLIVCQVYKNRNAQTGLLRYFADLGLKIFYPIKGAKPF